MLIEDEELRTVFKTASEEHLQKLDDGFLYLEKHPTDSAKLEELLREAHSLKGDAGMLGVKDVSTLAHQIEHILGGVKRGELTLTAEVNDRLSQGLEAIRKLVNEAVTGESSGVQVFYILAKMMGAATTPQKSKDVEVEAIATPQLPVQPPQEPAIATPPLPVQPPQEPAIATPPLPVQPSQEPAIATPPLPVQPSQEPAIATPQLPVQPPQEPQTVELTSQKYKIEPENFPQNHPINPEQTPQFPVNQSPSSTPTYRIESVRVATQNLDGLMTQAGELTVTKIRLAHRLAEIEEITNLWEEWSRDAFLNRFLLHDLKTHQNGSGRNSPMAQLQKYQQNSEKRLERLGNLVNRLRTGIYEDTARLDLIADDLEEGIRTLRLLPLSTIFNLFPRMVRDLSRQEGKEVELIIEGGETRADKRILEEMKDPLMHMIRNAIDHGIETPDERIKAGKSPTATIHLKGYNTTSNIIIEVSDDGRGLDLDRIKQTALKRGISTEEELAAMTPKQIHSLIFASGFSTRTFVTEVSGRGVGLDVVRTNVEALKGTIQVESTSGKGCTLRLQLSTTLATAHVLIASVDGIPYAFPVEFVQTIRLVSLSDIFFIENRKTIALDGYALSVALLSDLLELSAVSRRWLSKDEQQMSDLVQLTAESEQMPCIILKVGEERLGLFVDELIDEQDVVLKPQSQLLKRVRNVAGATILGTGEVCMVLNPQDLIKSIRKQSGSHHPATSSPKKVAKPGVEIVQKKPVILLAEDSIATRTQEKRILESAGYEVVTAVDGLDAYNKLKTRSFDGLVSDVQMPNLDGLSLTAKIRQHREYSELPIILVTSLASDEDKKRGAEAGANAYITKGSFNQDVLLETLKRLV